MPNEREINKLADKFRQSSVEVIINAEGERRWYTLTEQESKHLADISINYRAELTAPAEGDVAKDVDQEAFDLASAINGRYLAIQGRLTEPGIMVISEEGVRVFGEVRKLIAAALTTARKDAEARVKALEAENLGLRKTVGVDGKEIAELRAERDAAREAERKKCGLNLTFAAEGKGPLAGLGKMNPAKTIAELREQIADMKRGRELIPAEWAFVPMEPLLDAINAHIQARVEALEAVARSAEIDLGIAIDILEKHNYVHAKELQETRDKLAALLAGEGKGEGAGSDERKEN